MKTSKKASKSGKRVVAAQNDQAGWTWSEKYGNYYRTYTDTNGILQYNWQELPTAASGIPRSPVEQLEDVTAQLQVADNYDQLPVVTSPVYTLATLHTEIDVAHEAGVTDQTKPGQAEEIDEEGDLTDTQTVAYREAGGKSRRKSKGHGEKPPKATKEGDKKGKGKGKELMSPVFRPVRSNTAPAATGGNGTSTDQQPQDAGYGYQQFNASALRESPSAIGLQVGGESRNQLGLPDDVTDPSFSDEPTYDPEEDVSVSQALARSRQTYLQGYRQQLYGLEDSHAGSSSSQAPKYELESYDDDEGTVTPATMQFSSSLRPDMYATTRNSDGLDKRYRVHPSKTFEPGEVFLREWWPEPLGQSAKPGNIDSERTVTYRGEGFYFNPRRFIVIRNKQGHATCVPIHTYRKRACTKPGVKERDHGIIHTTDTQATLLPGERPLGFRPVRLKVKVLGQMLEESSRVNYAKLTSIEHNIKVFFIGSIHPDDWHIVRGAVDQCWMDSTPHKSERKPHRSQNKR